ncbi:endoplasmic reticulum membrane-associated RNA degradation protein-like [Sabethes cyaneus]|uniref:endoplasmic reticulum membrane-associated RNA degradation protein-like n=1 Tax=Sabethes cyaneus TaxID=53552 RepID=UPI00237EBC96|nr:endoplasmic reticulum membrane-associated RNA degradation protein-like [Sabethes cyaneus]
MQCAAEEYQSFLSTGIKELLLIEKDNCRELCLSFSVDGETINWLKVEEFFEGDIVGHNQPLPYEYCRSLTPKLNHLLKCLPAAAYSAENLAWTNRVDLLALVEPSSTEQVLSNVLLLTSITEYALGNVFQTTTGSTPPHLLRDLLMTDALADVFGETPLFLLRLLVGTPEGINLRNLVWHGFPRKEEICPLYANVLLLLLVANGETIRRKKVRITHRTAPENLGQLVQRMSLGELDESLFETILNEKNLVCPNLASNWQEVLDFYRTGRFYQCVCFALPLLEMCLRKLYGVLYKVDYRARIDEYYIIMDTVFSQLDLFGARSKIFEYFSTPLLELMYDLLTAVNGPRLRDKLSHGEVELRQINRSIANVTLTCAYLLLTADKTFSYRSIFHPNSICQSKISECEEAVGRISTITVPMNLAETDLNPVEDIPFLPNGGAQVKVVIFFRPSKEEEIVGILTRICTVLKVASENLCESLTVRLTALENRQLRSRARNTLENMLRMYPTVLRGLDFVLRLIKWIFHCLMNSDELANDLKIVRFLKFILKYTENAASNLHMKSNTWQPLYETTKRELFVKSRQNLADDIKIFVFKV